MWFNNHVKMGASVRIICGSSDTVAMLVQCSSCGNRACYTFGLDPPPPPPPPWTCSCHTQGHHRSDSKCLISFHKMLSVLLPLLNDVGCDVVRL